MFHPSPDDEPTPAELAAIEAEWPLIEAEMSLVDAEILVMTADPRPSLLDWRRLRRAEQRVLHEAARLADRPGVLRSAWAA
ncbi:MAG TPA: DUF6284 family protein [Micromonosporaceae bacterium]